MNFLNEKNRHLDSGAKENQEEKVLNGLIPCENKGSYDISKSK